MVFNLLKAHPLDQIQAILAKSFAQFQLNQRAETLESKLDVLREQMEPYGPRVCSDWITQWQVYDHARKQKAHRIQVTRRETPELAAKLHFLSPGRVVGFPKGRGLVLRVYRSRGQRHPMVTVLRPGGSISESPANMIAHIYDRVLDVTEAPAYPWCTPKNLDALVAQLSELPTRLPVLPMLVQTEPEEGEIAHTLTEEFPCPTCPSRPVPQGSCRRLSLAAGHPSPYKDDSSASNRLMAPVSSPRGGAATIRVSDRLVPVDRYG